MKKLFLILFLFSGIIASASGNDTIASKIVFYREYNYQGSAISYPVYVYDEQVIKLKNNSFFEFYCRPGEYDLVFDKYQGAKLHLKAEAGKTYYLRLGIRMGVWSGIPELLLVDSTSAYPAIYNGKMRQMDGSNTPFLRPKNRIGMNLNMGFGFQDFPMITLTNGDESNISFGGGVAIGLKYGYEFNRYFDLAMDLNYQFSTLKPYVKNADISFDRGIYSITPSLIIPLSGGDAMRFKLGGGMDFYWGNALIIETSDVIGGFSDIWTYGSTIGYHAGLIYELNIDDKWSFNYGLKWYKVGYLVESTPNSTISDENLRTPDGSGLDLLFGIYYHF